ncbi:MAG TPA: hypothetical protein VFU05_12450 [Cyclobacteriaceae bacterium]|nr:hypothetical protein [Cyclobacteriaceae bacterium]
MKKVVLYILLIGSINCFAQEQYDLAFSELKGMLNDSLSISFKRAVFVTENAYSDNQLSYEGFNEHIGLLTRSCSLISKQIEPLYNGRDKENVKKYAAVFKLMTDTLKFYQNEKDYYSTIPYMYDFDDFLGDKDWRKMFVTKLLTTHTGNCHSLPFLYKILCKELDVKAYLAMAPNHTYIKLWCEKMGWYNTELTSGYFPIDAWIMASGYVHLSAVQNRVYMDTLSDKQSIAVCLIDLAKGYEKKYGDKSNYNFIAMCCNLALKYYPQYVNGLLLKAETYKKVFQNEMVRQKAEYPSDLFSSPEGKSFFDSMQSQYVYIHQLGYRKMPDEMYLSWLTELKREREKYVNKKIQDLNSSK